MSPEFAGLSQEFVDFFVFQHAFHGERGLEGIGAPVVSRKAKAGRFGNDGG